MDFQLISFVNKNIVYSNIAFNDFHAPTTQPNISYIDPVSPTKIKNHSLISIMKRQNIEGKFSNACSKYQEIQKFSYLKSIYREVDCSEDEYSSIYEKDIEIYII